MIPDRSISLLIIILKLIDRLEWWNDIYDVANVGRINKKKKKRILHRINLNIEFKEEETKNGGEEGNNSSKTYR